MQLLLDGDGYRTVAGDAAAPVPELLRFFARHDPGVVIYDIPPPYAANWRRFAALRAAARPRPFVVTTTSPTGTEEDAAQAGDPPPVIGLPFDIEVLLTAVREATARLRQQADASARALARTHRTTGRARDLIEETRRRLGDPKDSAR